MKLTGRQEEFIRNLLDLYHEANQPLHYTELAERLGVNRFTAYDMLRLLEEKGFAASTYRLAEDKNGPGRSEVVFMPTERAHQLVADLTQDQRREKPNWEAAKDSALRAIRSGAHSETVLADELLGRIPVDDQDSQHYCLEVITTMALRLRQGAGRRLLVEYLPSILPNLDAGDPEDLSLLGGFVLGILAQENSDDPQWLQEMFEHVRRFQTLISEMTPDERSRLGSSINQVYTSLTQNMHR
jgi:DNA-binding MarR family transcriptional regulator